jgi:hypothetical protein
VECRENKKKILKLNEHKKAPTQSEGDSFLPTIEMIVSHSPPTHYGITPKCVPPKKTAFLYVAK